MKCKYCGVEVGSVIDNGFIAFTDIESERLKELKLKKGEIICIGCKKELLFANIISIL